jgi:hypothetical protein
VKDIIAKGEKLAAEPKAPEFLAKVKNTEIKSFLDSKYFSACLKTNETLFSYDFGVRLIFNVQKLTEMKDLWAKTSNAAKDRLKDLKVKKQLRIFRFGETDPLICFSVKGNSAAWNTFADKCAQLSNHVKTAQKQIDDVKKVSNHPLLLPLKGLCKEMNTFEDFKNQFSTSL